jgi:four helix bundle protein
MITDHRSQILGGNPMKKIGQFEDMEVWVLARKLANQIYDVSEKGAFAWDFGLRDQMRRAAVSILSNIAEGYESDSDRQFIRYLGFAKASAGELRAQLYIALDRKYLSQQEFSGMKDLTRSCSRQLAGLVRYLSNNPRSRRVREETFYYEILEEF